MLLAIVMHRTIFGRGAVRTFARLPTGSLTVAAAYAGCMRGRLTKAICRHCSTTARRMTSTLPAIVVIILAEVGKTTAVHGAAAARRAIPWYPRICRRRRKWDGATAWQRFPPHHTSDDEAGDLVALLLRTLDDVRIFDTSTS